MEIAKRLADPAPYDLKDVRLDEYKGLASRWRVWPDVAERCRHFGQLLGERLVLKGP